MNRTLLDTDILSDFLRGKDVNVVRRVQAYMAEHGRLTISAVTIFEVVRGRCQAQQSDRATQFLAWTRDAEVLAFDDKCARTAGEIAGALIRTGMTVGVADILIAATTLANDATLATANVAHYQRLLPFGLAIENWREPVRGRPRLNTPPAASPTPPACTPAHPCRRSFVPCCTGRTCPTRTSYGFPGSCRSRSCRTPAWRARATSA
jgi:tRNA(fMet)-specific endonuclease VapC